MIDAHSSHSAVRRRRAERVRVLMATDVSGLAEAQAVIATLPMCATGRLFVEVDDASMVGLITTPPRMTVTWLPRHRAGDRRAPRPRGVALTEAVRGWASEMLCDGQPAHVWLRGDYRGVAAIHEYLTESAGLDDSVIDRPERFALGGPTTRVSSRDSGARTTA